MSQSPFNETTTIESWFIPFDIFLIVCTFLVILLSAFFFSVIVLDKTCHTVSMMLTANSCVSTFIWGCVLLSLSIYSFINDIKHIAYQDSFCIYRTYFNYVSPALFHHSKLLQTIYAYVTVVYPHRLFLKSAKFQFLIICVKWIYCFIYPFAFMFLKDMRNIYNIENQICQLPLRLCFSRIYAVICVDIIPISTIILIYFKLVQHVYAMKHHITPVNRLLRARNQLKIVQRIVKIVMMLLILGLPYVIFILISFFTTPIKYSFRIAYIFIDISLILLMIAAFRFNEPLRKSIKKRIQRRNT